MRPTHPVDAAVRSSLRRRARADGLANTGVYLPKDVVRTDLNWVPLHGDRVELCQGVDVLHTPGHTPGFCTMQVNLAGSGTWLVTTDQFHVRENYHDSQPQGWLARDHDDWVRSSQLIKGIEKRTGARVVFGHCREVRLAFLWFCLLGRGWRIDVACLRWCCADALLVQGWP